jgi:hypothetical protein
MMEHKSILRSQSNLSTVDNDLSPISKFMKNKKLFWTTLPKRYILAVYAFFGFFFAYSLRANLSVAIVQMSVSDIANENASHNFTHDPVI